MVAVTEAQVKVRNLESLIFSAISSVKTVSIFD